jgi:hypothetical protein
MGNCESSGALVWKSSKVAKRIGERERTIDITLFCRSGWLGNGWVIFELVQFNDLDQTSSRIRNEFVAAIRGRVFERRTMIIVRSRSRR